MASAGCAPAADGDGFPGREEERAELTLPEEPAPEPAESWQPGHGEWEALGSVPQIVPTPESHAADAERVGDGTGLFNDRHSAMLVLADGTAFGRVGDPTDVPEVTSLESAGIPADYDDEQAARWILEHAEELDKGGRAGGGSHTGEDYGTPRALIGSDNRIAIDNTTTLTTYPWRTVGTLLYHTTAVTNAGCTGTQIGPRHVLTNAHCIHDCNGNWKWPIWFSPGQQGGTENNGGPRAAVGVYARVCDPLGSDYGVVILQDSAATAANGWAGYGWFDPVSYYSGETVYVAGYPLFDLQCADSPRGDGKCGGFMYRHIKTFPNVTQQSTYLYHTNDATSGQSGSSLIWFSGSVPLSLGVHKRGNDTGCGATITASPPNYNIAARMRSAMWDDVCAWIGDTPSAFGSHGCQ